MTKDAIRSIQTGLAALGHDPGKADGLFGPKTRTAAERWLAADGKAAATQKPVSSTGAMIYQGAARYPVDEIIVHCSATAPAWLAGRPLADKLAEIRRWHTSPSNNWNDIGYHWIIDRDGQFLPGRAENVIGAHTGQQNKNRGTIGICLLGGLGSTERDPFSKNFTAGQDSSLRYLIGVVAELRFLRDSHCESSGLRGEYEQA
ncbi:N-acetylmuramoyl-L-alanine amidase [Paracoccus alcaliphilus]|uniref:N-acetylmuramoyl-L-alanine amidase n=2 Tax=Paracoccus alcaliphilus TaxID=34002 RepID=A0A1H8K1U2_9RHOB|nr:N-acetylmuramoyl-L-alanine amidase [Paracoccus alcaliphilus]